MQEHSTWKAVRTPYRELLEELLVELASVAADWYIAVELGQAILAHFRSVLAHVTLAQEKLIMEHTCTCTLSGAQHEHTTQHN